MSGGQSARAGSRPPLWRRGFALARGVATAATVLFALVGIAAATPVAPAAAATSTVASPHPITQVIRPSASQYETCVDGKSTLSTWMSCLYPSGSTAAKTTTLSTLVIPGTHDSGTFGLAGSRRFDTSSSDCTNYETYYQLPTEAKADLTDVLRGILGGALDGLRTTLDTTVAAMGITQSMTLTTQLRSGIRYLNLRVAWDGSQWQVVHTLFSTQTLTETLDEIATWAATHPEESVVVDFEHICLHDQGATTGDQATLWKAFNHAGTKGKSLCDVAYTGSDPTTTSLQTMLYTHAGHNVVVMGHPTSTLTASLLPGACFHLEGSGTTGTVKMTHAWPENVNPEFNQTTNVSLTNIPSICTINPTFTVANSDLQGFALWPRTTGALPAIGGNHPKATSAGGFLESQLLYSLNSTSLGAVCTILDAGSLKSWEGPLTSGTETADIVEGWGNATNIVATDFPGPAFIDAAIRQNTVTRGTSDRPFEFTGDSNGKLVGCATGGCETLDSLGYGIDSLVYANGYIYAGTSAGGLLRCLPTTPTRCGRLDTAGRAVDSLTYANGHIYAGLSNGILWQCLPTTPTRCTTLDTAGSAVQSLAYADGHLYAGTGGGTLWKCAPTTPNQCQTLDSAGNGIDSVAYDSANGDVYAGLSNGILWQCLATTANRCGTLDTAGSAVQSLAYADGYLYAGTGGGTLWKCLPTTPNQCQTLDSAGSALDGIGVADDTVYTGTGGGTVWQCGTSQVNDCFTVGYGAGVNTVVLAPNVGVSLAAAPTGPGYREVAADGGIFAFGQDAAYEGSMGGQSLNATVVGMAGDRRTGGYWEAASDGGVFSFTAPFYGSMGGKALNSPVVGIAAAATGRGYDEVAADGGVFAFGSARFVGSMSGKALSAPIVGMVADPDGTGYWLVSSDGGIFSFTAPFYGSMGAKPLSSPVVGMAAEPDGGGYWLVSSDGGVFAFGSAHYHGSMGGKALNSPVVGITAAGDGLGYREVAADGGVFTFGSAGFDGSMAGQPLNSPVVGITAALVPTG